MSMLRQHTGKKKHANMLRHVFFDLDKTLTVSRTPLSSEHQDLFEKLCAEKDVVVVTGGSAEQIREQITPRFDGKYYMLAQSGNHCVDKNGDVPWNEALNETQIQAVFSFIELLKKDFAIPVKDSEDLTENRGAQITYSVLGFHEDNDKKYAFDPGDTKRRSALKTRSAEVENLKKSGVAVEPAGTTSFNFFLAGRHKGFNIERFLKLKSWEKDDCLYVGDALFPGGNDESVVGVIPTHPVKDPDETFDFIRNSLLSS